MLLDYISLEKVSGQSDLDAVVVSVVPRLRPVVLAAGTTALGIVPLLQDVF